MSEQETLWSQQYLDAGHQRHEAVNHRRLHNERASESMTWMTCILIVATAALALFLMTR